jgi:hypothetical protein
MKYKAEIKLPKLNYHLKFSSGDRERDVTRTNTILKADSNRNNTAV